MRVAVFPCGTEIGAELHRSLSNEKNVELFGFSSMPCHGQYIYDKEHYDNSLPFVTDPMFFVRLGELKRQYGIDLVIPANDKALEYFALNEQPMYHPYETVMTCSRKSRTYKALDGVVRTPIQYSVEDHPYEVFLKPDEGHSGIGCKHVTTDAEFIANYNGQLILEYLGGAEYTVDCFSAKGTLLYCMARTRENITKGISALSKEDTTRDWHAIANSINDKLKFNGAWFCQFKLNDDGEPVLMECAARIGGSSGLNRSVGVNLPLLDLFNFMGHDVEVVRSIDEPAVISRSLGVSASLPDVKDIYIDLDDTLILNGRVNHNVIAFIYKYRDKYNIHLLTRNKDPYRVLQENQLLPSLFRSICICKIDQKKSDYVKDGLLIDDSHAERKGCKAIDANSIQLYL